MKLINTVKDRYQYVSTRTDLDFSKEVSSLAASVSYLVTDLKDGRNFGTTRLSKAIGYGTTAMNMFNICRKGSKLVKILTENRFELKFNRNDEAYDLIEELIAEEYTSPFESRVLSAETSIDYEYREDDRDKKVSRIIPIPNYEDKGVSTVIEGISVFVEKPSPFTNYKSTNTYTVDKSYVPEMVVRFNSIEDRTSFVKMLEEKLSHQEKRSNRLYMSNKAGGFNRRTSDLNLRDRDSVILKEGQLDRILGYLNTFRGNRDAYKSVGIPYRTGIMLYGDPGSGKSSTAMAIASEMEMDVWTIQLSSLENDDALAHCFSNIPPNVILLLEDIDVVSAVRERDGKNNSGVTMSGMLNALDGIMSPEGVITIMTTNRLDTLDPAIKRPGRVDLMEELGNIDQYQLEGLFRYFVGHVPENLPRVTPEDGISSSSIVGVVRKYLPNFSDAEPELIKYIEDKIAGREVEDFSKDFEVKRVDPENQDDTLLKCVEAYYS